MKKLKETKERKVRLSGIVLAVITLMSQTGFALASNGSVNPQTAVNNLSTLFISLISALGGIILLWSIVQLGIGMKRHDPAATSEALLGVVAGLIIAGGPWVVSYILGK